MHMEIVGDHGAHLEDVDDDARVDGVERRGGLVEQQDGRVGDHLDADADAAHLSPREAADADVLVEHEVALLAEPEQLAHGLAALRAASGVCGRAISLSGAQCSCGTLHSARAWAD